MLTLRSWFLTLNIRACTIAPDSSPATFTLFLNLPTELHDLDGAFSFRSARPPVNPRTTQLNMAALKCTGTLVINSKSSISPEFHPDHLFQIMGHYSTLG